MLSEALNIADQLTRLHLTTFKNFNSSIFTNFNTPHIFNMAALDKIIMMVLRAFQLVGAVVVISLASKYISSGEGENTEYHSRFIIAVVVSVVSAFFGFIWLLPFSSNHMNYYIDGFLAVANAAVTAWIMWVSTRMTFSPDFLIHYGYLKRVKHL